MRQKIRIMVLLGLAFLLSNKAFSQIGISYYSSSLPKIGLSYDFSGKTWTELRLYSNTVFRDLTPELVVCHNFVHTEKYNVYAGLGGVVNVFNGVVFPIGVQFTPEKFDKFSLHIELQPTVLLENDLIVQSSWGIRYRF
ncbi:MAG TPA: hypothetical protein VK152_12715 [Paludibacter sp.]|nr:hypothetical protein [Paludibacter sp.]